MDYFDLICTLNICYTFYYRINPRNLLRMLIDTILKKS